jgi:phosphate transport system substrate-binding protein
MKGSKLVRLFLFFACGLSLFGTFSCDEDEKTRAANNHLRMGVEQSLPYIFESEIDIFQYFNNEYKITPVYLTESELIQRFINDSFRLIVTYRDFSAKEKAALKAKKTEPYSTVIGYEGLTLIVNPESPDTMITVAQLKQLLVGKGDSIEFLRNKWKDIVFDSKGSANLRYIDSLIGGKKLSDRCFAKKSNEEAIDFVAQNKNALGIISYDAIADKQDPRPSAYRKKIRLVKVSTDGKEYFFPSAHTFNTFEYPFQRPIYMHSSAYIGTLAMNFVLFVTKEQGQTIISQGGLLPSRMPYEEVNVIFENVKVK